MKRECYEIIKDKDALQDFIDNHLPNLNNHEKFYVCLFARKKYSEGEMLTNDKTQLKRFLANKENLIDKIEQLEIPIGRYRQKNGKAISQKTLALYISANPRCMKSATRLVGKKAWDLFNNENFNIHAEALSCIQKSNSRKIFLTFDIDDKNQIGTVEDYTWLEQNLARNFKLIETRGGYHLLVSPEDVTIWRKSKGLSLNWHQIIREKFKVDQTGDIMLPVIGCTQGGFIPKIVFY